jgi:hypothetical protein
VTSKTGSALPSQHAPLARLLAFALLVFIFYGATAEVAHKHAGNVLDRRVELAAVVSTPDQTNSSSENSRPGSECLICQLHQHLFISLINTLPQVAPPPSQLARTPASAISYLSHADTPQRGRAPPPASLL